MKKTNWLISLITQNNYDALNTEVKFKQVDLYEINK